MMFTFVVLDLVFSVLHDVSKNGHLFII